MNLNLGFLFLCGVYGVSDQCFLTEVKSLLEGCDHLTGLTITSVGGTIVNDHNCNVLLPKEVFTDEPIYQYDLAETKKYYTIFILDPDAPLQVKGEFFLHMLKFNVPGSALITKEGSKTCGVEFRSYLPPTPAPGTGEHRYISLVYEQAGILRKEVVEEAKVPTRHRFSLSDWMRGKNLCGPVAGMQFRCSVLDGATNLV